MGRGSAGLIAAVLALAGCKSTTDPKPADRNPNGTMTGRGKDSKNPTWIDPVAKQLPGTNTAVPKAGTWGDPRNPNFDAKAEAQDAVGGKVVDVFNRPAKNIFIRLEAVNDPPGAAKGIYTDGNGYFFTRGLKPGTTYNLTAEASQDGKQLTGSAQVRVPNPVLTIVLREGLNLPPPLPTGSGEKPVEGFPPPPVPSDSDRLPPMGIEPLSPGLPRTNDGAFSPGGGAARPVPPSLGAPPAPKPVGPIPGAAPLPDPDDLATPTKTIRPENVAEGGRSPFTPPAASIPGPPVPSMPAPPLPGGDSKPTPTPPRGRGTSYRLLDSLERNWDFATDKSGSVVLVEFVTTVCPNCKPVVPVLKDIQARYGTAGLQVIAVLCDDVPQKARAAAAAKYAKDNGTNYPVFIEPGNEPGAVRDPLGVESYPRAVLLDSQGRVLWNGHPAKRTEMEAAIRKALGK
jgi:thiol-disulfide isomerase/thioredoxin